MKKLPSDEPLIGVNGLCIGDFWSWAYSDILSNRNRSVFAEFLVGSALGITEKPRVEWDAVDFYYRDKKIEVKSAAYVQSWKQAAPSVISFDIGMKKSWEAATGLYLEQPLRSADCYVFCLYAETCESKINILDITHWHFYVVLTEQINQQYGSQKKIRLSRLQALCRPVDYYELPRQINTILKL